MVNEFLALRNDVVLLRAVVDRALGVIMDRSESFPEGHQRKRSNGSVSPETIRVPDAYIEEWVRGQASEMHNLAAFMGGIASQEIVKILTAQFVPICQTLVYDGLKSTTTVFDF